MGFNGPRVCDVTQQYLVASCKHLQSDWYEVKGEAAAVYLHSYVKTAGAASL